MTSLQLVVSSLLCQIICVTASACSNLPLKKFLKLHAHFRIIVKLSSLVCRRDASYLLNSFKLLLELVESLSYILNVSYLKMIYLLCYQCVYIQDMLVIDIIYM